MPVSVSRWSLEKVSEWYSRLPWLVGCNYIPSSAVNQLEMWQEATFDPDTMDRELSWAAGLGMNTVRVFLHDLLWKQDAKGFVDRIDLFLNIANRHGIRVMLVLLDDCWFPDARLGPQPPPVPGIHNSRWLQAPGHAVARNRAEWPRIKDYIQGVVGAFSQDHRVMVWDVYNELGNAFLPAMNSPWYRKYPLLAGVVLKNLLFDPFSAELLKQAVRWIREISPQQPITAGIWFKYWKMNDLLIANSDVISFHHYGPVKDLEKLIIRLQKHQRPLLCTEYLARTLNSRFETHLPLFKQHKVGCYNWGLVSGKTQTIFTWQDKVGDREPELWFHDIFRKDGTPFSEKEVQWIREVTS